VEALLRVSQKMVVTAADAVRQVRLLVSRLEPQNNIGMIVKGFVDANPKYAFLVVGDLTSRGYRKLPH
jgi:hypothetical protein